jgi:hypothetical protein
VVGDELWVGNRGGDRVGEVVSQDGIMRFPRAALTAVLEHAPEAFPEASSWAALELGALEGCPLHLTELFADGNRGYAIATAEQTSSFFDDGVVVGSAVVVFGDSPGWTAVRDAAGVLLPIKIEGAVFAGPDRLYAVTDPDREDLPAQLLEIALHDAFRR